MSSKNLINFDLIIVKNGKEENIKVSEDLRDNEFSVDVDQIKQFIIKYMELNYNIKIRYEYIKIDIIRNGTKYKNRNDNFEIEDKDILKVNFVNEQQIPKTTLTSTTLRAGFEDAKSSLIKMGSRLDSSIELEALHKEEEQEREELKKVIKKFVEYKNDKYKSYEGERNSDGLPDGYGVLDNANFDDLHKITLDGRWINGIFRGQGKMTLYGDNGNILKIFEGEFDSNKNYSFLNGFGKKIIYDKDGNISEIYEGTFTKNVLNGYGMIFSDTEEERWIYNGEIEENTPNGYGKMDYLIGDVYVGDFIGGLPEGSGKMKYANGDVYEGNWENGFFSGFGVMTYANGDVYEGEWFKEELDEENVTDEEYSEYFKTLSVKQGKGKMTYINGRVDEGDWENDELLYH